jgi:hypothetical protein
VRLPLVVNVMLQLPLPPTNLQVQVSPVLAVTVTVPVGAVTPLTLNPMATVCETVDGFGEVEVIEVLLFAFSAVTFKLVFAGAYVALPACDAVTVQVPVPLVIFTTYPLSEHTPLAANVTGRLELALAEILKVASYTAEAGTPVSVTVCVSKLLVTVSVVLVLVAGVKVLSPA